MGGTHRFHERLTSTSNRKLAHAARQPQRKQALTEKRKTGLDRARGPLIVAAKQVGRVSPWTGHPLGRPGAVGVEKNKTHTLRDHLEN